jgi:WD40 repeat protein
VIVSASDNGTVRAWDAATSACLPSPSATSGSVTAVAIGQVGEHDIIVSGKYDGKMMVWDAVTGDCIGSPLIGHEAAVSSVAIGKSGDRYAIVSGSEDYTIILRECHIR